MNKIIEFKFWRYIFFFFYLMSIGATAYAVYNKYAQEKDLAVDSIYQAEQKSLDFTKHLFLDRAYQAWDFLDLIGNSIQLQDYIENFAESKRDSLSQFFHASLVRQTYFDNLRLIQRDGSTRFRIKRFSGDTASGLLTLKTSQTIAAIIKGKQPQKPLSSVIVHSKWLAKDMLVFIHPVYHNNELKGYLSTNMDLEKVFDHISALDSGIHSVALLNDDGKILYQRGLTKLNLYTDDLSEHYFPVWYDITNKSSGKVSYGKYQYSYRKLPLLLDDEAKFLHLMFVYDPLRLSPVHQEKLDAIVLWGIFLMLVVTLFFICLPLLYGYLTKNQRLLDAELKNLVLEGVAPIAILDARLRYFDINRAFEKHFCCSSDEVKGKRITRYPFQSRKSFKRTFTQIRDTLAENKRWKGEATTQALDGKKRVEIIRISQVHNKLGQVTHYVMLFTDISAHKEQDLQIKHQNEYDSQLRCFNRSVFEKDLAHCLLNEVGETACLAIIDIDKFKYINDTFGHFIGDEVLVLLTNVIQDHTRDTDILYRIVGGKFAMILNQAELYQAEKELERICEIVRHIDVHEHLSGIPAHAKLPLSISIGLAEINTDDSIKACYKKAENALDKAKNNEKNLVGIYRK